MLRHCHGRLDSGWVVPKIRVGGTSSKRCGDEALALLDEEIAKLCGVIETELDAICFPSKRFRDRPTMSRNCESSLFCRAKPPQHLLA